MNMKHALALAATIMAGPSFGITVNLTDFNYGPVIDVDVSGNQSYSGEAGEFKGSLGGVPGNIQQGETYSTGGAPFTDRKSVV